MEKQMAKKSIRCPQCTLSYPKREVRCPHCGQHPDQPVTPPESLVVREPQLGAAETVVLARTDAPPEPERAEATDQPNRHYGEGMARWQIAWDITKATAGLIKLGMWDIPWMAYDKVQVYRERRREVATPTPPDRVHDDEPAAPAPADRSAREDRPRRERPASSERRPASSADRPATSETRAPRTNERTNPVAATATPSKPLWRRIIDKMLGWAVGCTLILAIGIGLFLLLLIPAGWGAFQYFGNYAVTADRSIDWWPYDNWNVGEKIANIPETMSNLRVPEPQTGIAEETSEEQDERIASQGIILVVIKETVLKKGPATYAADLATLPAGSTVNVIGSQETDSDGNTWIYVSAVVNNEAIKGYVSFKDVGTLPQGN